MNIPVILPARMDRRNPLHQHIQHMQRLKRAKPMILLLIKKLAQFPPLDEFADNNDHLPPPNIGDLLVVVLQQDRAMPQGVELASIRNRRLTGRIAMGIVKLSRPPNPRTPLDNSINLALPTTS